ncbi:MAG: hypothetical protein WCE48_08215 [Steroidobacteraceae bacterium]
MSTRYRQLKDLHDRASATGNATLLGEIPRLLTEWGIRSRADDGRLLWTNVSNPTSQTESIAIGLRYEKQDGTLTEDLFTVGSTKPDKVVSHYTGRIQREWTEYANTHRQQDVERRSFTSVNTCSFYMGPLYGS